MCSAIQEGPNLPARSAVPVHLHFMGFDIRLALVGCTWTFLQDLVSRLWVIKTPFQFLLMTVCPKATATREFC